MLIKLALNVYQLANKETGNNLLFPSESHAVIAAHRSVEDHETHAKQHGNVRMAQHFGAGLGVGALAGAGLKYFHPGKLTNSFDYKQMAGLGALATAIPGALSGVIAGHHAQKKWREKNDLKSYVPKRLEHYSWGQMDNKGNGHYMKQPIKNFKTITEGEKYAR